MLKINRNMSLRRLLILFLLGSSGITWGEGVGFRQFATGAYETSCIVPMPEGDFLVVEDEEDNPLTRVSFGPGDMLLGAEMDASDLVKAVGGMDDLEGCAVDGRGWIYLTTSHSRNSKGEAKFKREKLLRFALKEGKFVQPKAFSYLKIVMTEQFPLLQEAAEIEDVKNQGGLNIEGMAWDEEKQQLVFGFRSPLQDNKAVVLRLTNPDAVFDQGVDPQFEKELILLDLAGDGVRAMSYDKGRKGFWLISGPMAKRDDVPFQLWFWQGQSTSPAQKIQLAGLPGVKRGEGITVSPDGRWLIIVSDDGNREEKRPAHYLLLPYDQVRVVP